MKPSKLTNDQLLNLAKTSVYIGVSAMVSYAITNLSAHPELFGVYWPMVNLVLVAIKQVFTAPEA